MELILGATLLVVGLIAAAVVAVAVPVLAGVILWDLSHTWRTRERKPLAPETAQMRIEIERGVARGFVIAGGLFWSSAIFAGLYSFKETGLWYALLGAFFPLVAVLATLIVGWYYERVASAMLAVASVAVVAWGVIFQFEVGVWALMTLALIGPMMTASVLFWMARREQEAFEFARQLELAPMTLPIND